MTTPFLLLAFVANLIVATTFTAWPRCWTAAAWGLVGLATVPFLDEAIGAWRFVAMGGIIVAVVAAFWILVGAMPKPDRPPAAPA